MAEGNYRVLGFVAGVGFSLVLNAVFGGSPFVKSIPKTDNVSSGYVIPSKLEIKIQDLNGDGKKETLMKYDGRQYLLTLDSLGNPQIQSYEVKPAEIVQEKRYPLIIP